MSRIERAAFAAKAGFMWKAALPVLGLALASLVGCAQAPAAQSDNVTRGSTAAAKSTAGLNTTSCAKPEYPQDARRRGSQGTTTIRFLIDTDGSVGQSDIVKSSGDASLDEAARSALAKCRFKPAMKEGKPRRAWVPVQYVWTMDPASKPPAAPVTAQP